MNFIEKINELQAKDEISASDLVPLINSIHELFIEGKFNEMNDWLLTEKKLQPELAISVARTTYPVRSRLSNWNLFVQTSLKNINEMGYNGEKLLRGLL